MKDAGGRRDHPTRVLLVDDVPEVRTLIRAALRLRGGFEVVGEASSGVAGVTLTGEVEPDLVVLDLGLPDITGRDVLTRIREQRPEAKVVIFSGVDPHDRHWYEERAAGYVLKDADVEFLVDLLESLAHEPGPDLPAATLALPEDLASVRDARRFVLATMSDWGIDGVVDEASVVVTELAANAVLHARSDFELRLSLTPSEVRIEITDGGPGTPEPQPPTDGGESGRGLLMVAALSVSWGVDSTGDGRKTVWSSLARPDAAPAGATG